MERLRTGDATVEVAQAQIFRVGRRRFLTERAAFTHMARLRIAAMRPCECDPPDRDDFGRTTYEGYTCQRHNVELVVRYGRLLRRAWKRGWRQ